MTNLVFKNDHELRNYFLLSIGLIFFLGLTEFLGLTRWMRNLGEWAVRPSMEFGAMIVNGAETPYFVAAHSFESYKHLENLELQYAQAVAQQSEVDSLKAENQELKKLVEQGSVAKKNGGSSGANGVIVAGILSYGQPFIDKGRNDGVTEGNMILIGNTLMGRVSRVSNLNSEISLLSQTNVTPVLVKTESGATGIVSGDGRQVLIKELPTDADVKVGERVVTEGQMDIPQGISVGKIQSITKNPNSPTQEAVVDQIVSFYQSHIVEVRQQ